MKNKNPDSMTGECAVCGPVKLAIKGKYKGELAYMCWNVRQEQQLIAYEKARPPEQPRRMPHSQYHTLTEKNFEASTAECAQCGPVQMTTSGKCDNYSRSVRLKKYGLTLNEWATMFEQQGGRCAICKSVSTDMRRFHVDHDHSTGAVRELLCTSCNVGLGHFKDNVKLLRAAERYLTKHSSGE